MRAQRVIRPVLLAAAVVSAAVFLGVTGYSLATAHGWNDLFAAFWWDAWLGFSVVGGVLVLRCPQEPIGRLLTLIGFFAVLSIAGSGYANRDYGADHRVGLLGVVASVVFYPAFAAAAACTSATVLTFPTGRLTSRLQLFGGRLIEAAGTLVVIGYLLRARLQLAEGKWVDNPLHPPFLGSAPKVAIAIGTAGLLVSAVVALVSAVVTFRRSQGDVRQQMRWFARSTVILPVLFVISVVVSAFSQTASNSLVWLGLVVGLNAIAVAIGFAVARYRLYDIDRVVSRTASYLLITGLVAGGYVGLVALTESVLGFSSSVAVAASTLAAAAAFQPVRRRVQHAIDRRFDRSIYDARRLVEEFSQRLRDAVDVDRVTADLVETVIRAVAPSSASIWTVHV